MTGLLLRVLLLAGALCCMLAGKAHALEAVTIKGDQDRIDITAQAEHYAGRGDRLEIDTAPGPDGLSGRVEVKAQTASTNPNWMVFALRNTTDKSVERWLVADRFTFIGSGIAFPDLDARRIVAVTPSQGFVPERIASDRADIIQITIDPGQTVTLAAEMASEKFPRVSLWKPFVYESKQRERELLNGILLGISGLLALFLTVLFAANHKVIFPATGLLAWSIVALLCVDFDFWHRIFRLAPEDNALYRAACESAVAASLVLFLYVFLKLGRWHSWIRAFWLIWIAAQFSLVVLAPLDPGLAATLARYSYLVIAGLGSLFILYLVLANQDRALALLPVWLLLLVWVFAASLAAVGRLAGEFIAVGLVSGLVLILLMIGFTVTQFAFRSAPGAEASAGETSQTRNYAIDGAGLATFEWSSRRNEVQTGPLIEDILGLGRGRLNCGLEDWLKHVGPRDQDRLREQFKDIQVKGGGVVNTDFMMRGSDNSPHWFALRGASLPQAEARTVRCVGILRETTREKQAHERILMDAIRDHRTGLPNRELFMDRVSVAIRHVRAGNMAGGPALLLFEIAGVAALLEEFDETTVEGGLRSMLKRLQNTLGPLDSIGRIGPDRYGILVADAGDANRLAKLIETIRHAIRSPVPVGRSEQVFNANIGVAPMLDDHADAIAFYHDAETALERAKRSGTDRFEVFRASMRFDADARASDASLLRKAMEARQISLGFQPIYFLSSDRLAGLEAIPRWRHPERGLIGLKAFMPMAEQAGFALPLVAQLLEATSRAALSWLKALPRETDPLFVSIDLGGGLALRAEVIQEVRKAVTRTSLARGTLRLEVSDEAIRDNPELACDLLERLHAAGASVALTGFGAAQLPLGVLPRLDIEAVRLDRSLSLEALGGDPGLALVRGVASLARELGLVLYCDALEAPTDVSLLQQAGCTLGSGPLYGDILAESGVASLLTAIRNAEGKDGRSSSIASSLLGKMTRSIAKPDKAAEAATDQSIVRDPLRRSPSANGNGTARTLRATKLRTASEPATAPVAPAIGATEAGRYDEALSATALASAYAAVVDVDTYGAVVNSTPEAANTQTSDRFNGQSQAEATRTTSAPVAASGSTNDPLVVPYGSVARAETPTLIVRQKVEPASFGSVAATKSGFARLQRGQFGTATARAIAPAPAGSAQVDPPAAFVTTSGTLPAVASGAPPGPFQAPAAAKVSTSNAVSSAFADGLPDADILRGLAARLEAALKRDAPK